MDRDQEQIAMQENTNKDQLAAVTFGEKSLSLKCPSCFKYIETDLIRKPETPSIVLGLCLITLAPHFVTIITALFLIFFTSPKQHACPQCSSTIGCNNKFFCLFTDEAYSPNFLPSGVVLTKKTIITSLLLAIICIVLAVKISGIKKTRFAKVTWQEYMLECIPRNQDASPGQCIEKYQDKLFVNWEGLLLRLVDHRKSNRKWYLHALTLDMKMNPSIMHVDNTSDILLTIDSDAAYYNFRILSKLTQGDLLRFNCSLHESERNSSTNLGHFHVESLIIIGHDNNYPIFNPQIEQN